MRVLLAWLLCSISLITTALAKSKGCAGGVPLQLAFNFQGYKPASSYCASSYPIATTTISKIFPPKTVTSVSTVTLSETPPAATTITNFVKRDTVQDQVWGELLEQGNDLVSSMCICLSVTSTFTKTIQSTYILTVPTTLTTYIQAQPVYAFRQIIRISSF